MLSWDDDNLEVEDDFLSTSNMQGERENHNQVLRACLLDDPDCEACQ